MENKDIIKEKAINYIENSPWFTNFHNNFKKSIKSFQKVNKGIKAYIGMPKSVTTRNTKKG